MRRESVIGLRHYFPHDRSLKTLATAATTGAHEEELDQHIIEELVAGGHVPDTFFHNAASADYDIPGQRYKRALSDELITGVEYDVQYCLGYYMGAHGHGIVAKEWLQRRLKLRSSQLGNLMNQADDRFDRVNFDLKLHHEDNIKGFIPYIERVPEKTQVFISSPNWDAVYQIARSDVKRPLTLLYTVNNYTRGTTRQAFMALVEREKLASSDNRRLGVSLRAELASEDFMKYLNDNGFYSLLFPVDTNRDLLRTTELGANGITSNNPRTQQVAELARRELQKAP
jgi:hypothetical protein